MALVELLAGSRAGRNLYLSLMGLSIVGATDQVSRRSCRRDEERWLLFLGVFFQAPQRLLQGLCGTSLPLGIA